MRTRRRTRRSRVSPLLVLLAAGALVGIIVIGIGVYISSSQLKVEFIENAEVGINETAYNDQFVKRIRNGQITTEKTLIDTSNLGQIEVSLAVKSFSGSEEVFTYVVSVVDHESPVISFANYLEANVGTEIDLLEGVSASDNSGEDITVTVEGFYDIHTMGEYQLTYVARDSSSNQTVEPFTLAVVDREGPVISFTSYLEITKGTDIDILKGVSVTDNSGENITVTVEGSYDVNTVGTYKLKLVACDSSLNKTEEELTLRVKDPASPSVGQTMETVYFVTSKGFQGEIRNGVTYIDGYLVANKTYSLPESYGNGLTAEMQSAQKQMAAAAKADGLNIYIVSGFRSYTTQKNLYNRYVSRDGVAAADTYSARPGYSEHQSGLAADFNSVDNSFAQTPEAAWLANNCYKYGFILRYVQGKTNETGYIYEPWHFRYVGTELAEKLYNDGDWITMEDYFGITSEYQ